MKAKLTHSRTCVYNINYHVVWSVKYRRKILNTEIEAYLKKPVQEIAKGLLKVLDRNCYVSLSVGICYSSAGYQEKLYPLADKALYETKNRGRAGCTLIDEQEKILAYWRDPDVENEA